MPKDGEKASAGIAVKPESELTDFERKQLALLHVGPGNDFDIIVERTAAFFNSPDWKEKRREKVKSVRDKKESFEIIWWQKPSVAPSKMATKFSVNVKDLKAGSLARILGDDPLRQGGKECKMFQYDTLLQSNPAEYFYGKNIQLNHSTHKAPIFTVAPRDMQGYLMYLTSFTAEQQEKLKLVPSKPAPADGDEQAAEKRKHLHVVAQCLIDFWHFNKESGIEEEARSQAAPIEKKHVLGSLFYYLIMAQEELDGSLTITMALDMDPSGSLPAKVVDMALSEQLEKMKTIVKLVEKEGSVEDYLKPYENTREYFPLELKQAP